MIKNLIFDFGGVVLTDDHIGVLFENEEFKKKVSFDEDKSYLTWKKYWPEVGQGKITVLDFYNKFQEEMFGKFNSDLSKFMFEEYKRTTHPLKVYDLLPHLYKNYPIYAITNIFEEGLEFKKNKFNLDTYFDLIVASSELGVLKPSPEIFKNLIEKTGILPSESLFVDDREKNINSANELGFKVFLYKDDEFDLFKKELNKLGVKYE